VLLVPRRVAETGSLLRSAPGAYPGRVPLPAVPLPSRRLVGELSLGLLLGVVGGWLAGLVRVRRP
jgi:hypothetical protein